MADDTLTDEQWSVGYGYGYDPYVIELGDGRQWLNMRNEGGVARAVHEHNRLAGQLRTARADTLTEAAEAVEAEADRCVGRQPDQYLAGLYGAADLLRTLAATEPADTGEQT